jgi:hypothetical protein
LPGGFAPAPLTEIGFSGLRRTGNKPGFIRWYSGFLNASGKKKRPE